ncbi:hypothetical protein [Aureliella helgolandensis]|uniref:Chromosome partition protein Smc n=1 Tax=Aureliella helgolandensis TaxID=2527968 RepID=A0A518FZW3_9BACT|nr:hypothetical protein [Aureliella helgolandensis]QDV21856.1 hypothetical protein Q31a_01350 [Aureliella helgolandensis]
MLKKITLLGVLALLGTVTVAGTGAWSYVRTGVTTASESVRSSVPIEWELKRARQMIQDLKPEIANNLQVVVREEVEVKKLSDQIVKKQASLAQNRDDIMRLKEDLQSGSTKFVYAGRNYSASQVQEDLSHRFKQFQVHEATTSKLEQVLDARERNLDAARMKLDEMLAAKRELEVQVENLQARMTMVEVAQTASPVSIDDSQLSHTRQLLDSIATRIDVAERLVDSEGSLAGSIRLDEPQDDNLLDEIATYFGEGQPEVQTLVSSQEL